MGKERSGRLYLDKELSCSRGTTQCVQRITHYGRRLAFPRSVNDQREQTYLLSHGDQPQLWDFITMLWLNGDTIHRKRKSSQMNPLVLTFIRICLYSPDFWSVAMYRMMTYDTN